MSLTLVMFLVLMCSALLLRVATSFVRSRAKSLIVIDIIIIVFTFSMLSYFMQPVEGAYTDMDRISHEVDLIRNGQLGLILSRYSINPLSALYIGFAALLGDPNILRLMSCAIMLGCLLYIPYAEWDARRISQSSYILTSITTIAICSIPNMVYGVRQGPALAIAILGAYLILMRGKHTSGITALLIAVLFHFSTIIILIAVLVSYIKSRFAFGIFCFFALGYTFISYELAHFFSAMGIEYASQLLGKMNGYYSFGSNYSMYASEYSQLAGYMRLGSCIFLYLIYIFLRRHGNSNNFHYARYFLLLIFITIGSIPTSTPLRRFSTFALYASIPFIGYAYSHLLGRSRRATRMTSITTSASNPRYRYSRTIQYTLLLLLIGCLGVAMFYDWHTYNMFELSTQQYYYI